MPQRRLEKAYYTFAKGINTDASPINFPENFSLDEQNFSLNLDGTRRRRRGLETEEGGASFDVVNVVAGDAFSVFHWSNVSNNPGDDLLVLQAGHVLHFFQDAIDAPSANKLDVQIDLLDYRTDGATNQQVRISKVDTAFGRGHLFVAGQYVNPFYVKYSAETETLTVTTINLLERDFEGIEDGIGNSVQPTTATTEHTYNLRNRGWTSENIATFVASQSKQPAKNMIPWKGLVGKDTVDTAEKDWTKEFSPDKLVAELFQDASAPVGHLIRSPFTASDTTDSGPTQTFPISTWTHVGDTITVTTDGTHGLSPGDTFSISGQQSYYESRTYHWVGGEPIGAIKQFKFNGTHTVLTAPSGTTLTIDVPFPTDFLSWDNQYAAKGTLSRAFIVNPSGLNAFRRPTNIAFFAGRVWYAGTPYDKLANRIYFSQVIESDTQYAKAYQVADPTQEEFNQLVDTDGGVIVIPEMAQLLQMVPYSSSLLLYATNGIWQIGPGGSGYFTATSYSIRKISETGAIAPLGVIMAENIPYYLGASGIYRILQDPQQGFLYVENVSTNRVDLLYNAIEMADKRRAQASFNPITKQIFWIYRSPDTSVNSIFDTILILDTRLQAYTKWRLGTTGTFSPCGIFAIKDLVKNDIDGPTRILGVNFDTNMMSFGAPESSSYEDWGAEEEPAFMVTGYEIAGNAALQKYGVWAHCFMGKTETGYERADAHGGGGIGSGIGWDWAEGVWAEGLFVDGFWGEFGDVEFVPNPLGKSLAPVGQSGCTLQARWDWADNTHAGKWGRAQQIYRHRRLYQPEDSLDNFEDGQPVLVTKNKIRGRGRSLHLKFESDPGKDSWLLGWQVAFGGLTGY